MTTELTFPGAADTLAQRTASGVHPVDAYIARLTTHTSRRSMRANLRRAARLMTGAPEPKAILWHNMTPEAMDLLRSMLAEAYAPATANATLSAVRGVLTACWRAELMTHETLKRVGDVDPVKGDADAQADGDAELGEDTATGSGRHLSDGEIAALFQHTAQDDTPRGARDGALLALLLGGGLRRAEAVAVTVGNVDPEAETVTVKGGKGRKTRKVPLASGAMRAIRDWLGVRGTEPGPLLLPVRKGGEVVYERDGEPAQLSPRAVARITTRLCQDAGVERFSPHDCRRTLAGNQLDAGVDIFDVSKNLGHASVDTTKRYDRRPFRSRRESARRVHLPVQARGA